MTSANPPVGPATPVSASVSLNVLTMNMHMGFGIFNRRFILPELREAVRTVSADIVFLQEVHGEQQSHARKVKDWPTISQYEFLADSMWSDFAYGRNAVYPDGDHGNALLSKYPIIQHENLDISIHGTEQRGLLHCILEVPHAGRVHAVCVHLGLRESHRRQQLKLLNELMARIPEGEPVIVAGDFNDWRRRADTSLQGSGLHEVFVERFGAPAKSFPARWPLLCLDRIYVRNATSHWPKVLSSRPWSHLSDHAPLAVELTL
ncbi:endonuclease/exonuclease/phosphatase family protein [Pseudomonas syringae]|uniref:endonuclease/exonuclease/phosphatase family protein n=1 Tax=Pseudomonas syringae TaxID=317 RepID=UPI001BCB268B|nr:endonuclease/exonuclease/phosphatase family protein [Pseudomonas syringae]QVI73723.1 endonuclease/exonuclease/phosphatase family protein [Pseudomonas syringae]QVI78727.1 endonuclease/exonuclease/phosphatase family protein [Pseudomonas syringae]QVK30543.1 endonuclease/exonuclease/phosphatase family protein [Pseudomonas syringae]